MGWMTRSRHKGRIVGFSISSHRADPRTYTPVNQIWFSVFLAWTVKATVLKYGGIGWYRHLRPLFLGLTLGGVRDGEQR